MTRHILFDLDGTLIDTAPEIADAVNATLRRLGRPTLSDAQVRDWVGHGARALLGRALGAPPTDAQWHAFGLDYAEHCGVRSVPYPGVADTLNRLREQGRTLALVTNKEGAFTHRVLAAHNLLSYFELIVSGDTLPVRKPDPAVIRHTLDALGADAEDTLFVGDSAVDVQTARAAGLTVWTVDYGYHHGELHGEHQPDRMIPSLAELTELPQRIALD